MVPFSIKTASAALIRSLDPWIRELYEFIINFVDDILCMSKNFEQHIQHLEQLFQQLREANVTLNFEKSKFARKELKFVGHIITTKGIKADPDKVQGIRDFKEPRTVKDIQSFLGLMNFYSKFAYKYAETIAPLLQLTRKAVKFQWLDKYKKAFEEAKQLFIQDVMLTHPRLDKPFIIQTDASTYSLGAVLMQIDDDGNMVPIAFASRTIKDDEMNFFTTEKELLAITWALEKFRTYLHGTHTILQTDHHSLSFARSSKYISARITRWVLAIQDYDITIEFLPGKNNQIADILSRFPTASNEHLINKERQVTIAEMLAKDPSNEFNGILKNLRTHQRQDENLQNIINNIAQHSKYIIKNGLLHKKCENKEKIVLPTKVIKTITIETHLIYAHAGPKKIYMILNESFHAKRLHQKIRQILAGCDTCQRVKKPNNTMHAKSRPIITTHKNELLSIDFYGALPATRYRKKYILVTVDAFTKYVKLYTLTKMTTKATIDKIFNEHIPKHGKPEAIISDHGTQFTAEAWKRKLQHAGIKRVVSAVRHPQSNIVERVNKELGRLFRTLVGEVHSKWDEYIDIIETCINNTHHETTLSTPHELQLQEKSQRPWNKILHINNELTTEQKTQQLRLARERIEKIGKTRATKFNTLHKTTTFNTGDKVMLRANNVSSAKTKQIAKFFDVYEGPYTIKKIIRNNTYVLIDEDTQRERGIFNSTLLRPYIQTPDSKE